MTNCFAILGLSESLILDPGDIEASWQAATREEHPDRSPGTQEHRAAALNKARATLSVPVDRLGTGYNSSWESLNPILSIRN